MTMNLQIARLVAGCFLLFVAGLLGGCSRGGEERLETEVTYEWEDVEEVPVILFLGDSLTAGFQLDPEDAFPALIQRRLDEEGLGLRVMNAGVSGDTTSDGLNRLDWLLTQPVGVMVIALGANDALRGQPIEMMEGNLREMIGRTRERYPEAAVVVAGMKMPVNLGEPYRSEFHAMYGRIAEDMQTGFIPFLLEGVGGVPELNLADGIHPNEAGHRRIAETVWQGLSGILASRSMGQGEGGRSTEMR
ncbi:MAG TPA: arylesterase [Kiritimatiellia bacterium]|nr:arylesterase [Kiritimatiellia bacterium]